jgi:pyruvate/2-oxoglutarate dehydrogenase complex dihydrolipoamide dehydrogenase (E3) component
VFSLAESPETLAVIGAEPIGCEFGQALYHLGSAVTLISSGPQILPKEDPEAAAVVEKQFLAEGMRVIKNARVEKVERVEGKKRLSVGEGHLLVYEILVAAGRTPNVESLNLEAAGVTYDRQGIKVNSKLQTSNSRIYACGDVIGGYQFTHVAAVEQAKPITDALTRFMIATVLIILETNLIAVQ